MHVELYVAIIHRGMKPFDFIFNWYQKVAGSNYETQTQNYQVPRYQAKLKYETSSHY